MALSLELFTASAQATTPNNEFKKYTFKLLPYIPGANELKAVSLMVELSELQPFHSCYCSVRLVQVITRFQRFQ